MTLWYKKLGFHNNPFSIKPAAFRDDLVAYDMSYIYKKITNGEILFVEGEYGTGKTTILKNIIRKFRGENRIIYYSFNTGDFNIKLLLEGANSFLRKMAGLRVKNIIMLLDEVQTLKTSEAKQLLNYYRDGTIQSIVFVSHDYDRVNFPAEVETFLNGNILRTVDLSMNEAIDLLKTRIGGLGILSDNMTTKLFKLAGKNPRRMFAYCEDVVRYAVEIGDDQVTDFHINEVLEDVVKEQEKKKVVRKVVKKEVKKVVKKTAVVKKTKLKVKAKPKKTVKKKPVVAKKPKKVIEKKSKPAPKKYKINKLIEDTKKSGLGTIAAKEEPVTEKTESDDEVPEYKVYFFDND